MTEFVGLSQKKKIYLDLFLESFLLSRRERLLGDLDLDRDLEYDRLLWCRFFLSTFWLRDDLIGGEGDFYFEFYPDF